MKQKSKFYHLRIIHCLTGLILILLGIFLIVSNLSLLKEPITEEEVKCYDKSSKEIIGVKCIDINDPEGDFGGIVCGAVFIAFFGGWIIVYQIILIKEERESDNEK